MSIQKIPIGVLRYVSYGNGNMCSFTYSTYEFLFCILNGTGNVQTNKLLLRTFNVFTYIRVGNNLNGGTETKKNTTILGTSIVFYVFLG